MKNLLMACPWGQKARASGALLRCKPLLATKPDGGLRLAAIPIRGSSRPDFQTGLKAHSIKARLTA